ncbi:xanthine dehydrogenase family protein subunit M [Halobacteriales archaeon QH_10_65_19]|jgi:carbon-monoxide dehydrogenase medium subunit|nr:MAG: xanthine dehydrogenase family protein subunit M [Halobacteriales archaeon QH_10_65_19]
MYPAQFEYQQAESVPEALDALSNNPEAELIAGGHSLLPTMKSGLADPEMLVDIGEIDDLHGIEHRDGSTRIGAMTSYADVADDDTLREEATIFAETAGEIGDVQVRNRGTVGGNIAHADPASDLPGAVLAADATMTVQGPDGERTVGADDFFQGMFATAVGENEILTAVEVPHEGTTGAYAKKPNPASGYALVGVAARLTMDGDTVENARLGANGVMDHGTRLTEAEDAIEGEPLSADTIDAAGDTAGSDLDEYMVMEDQQASAEFRLQLLGVYTERALEAAGERAGVLSV